MKKINKVKIKINGRKRSINSKISLKSLLSANKISLKKVAVEVNDKIINKKKIIFKLLLKYFLFIKFNFIKQFYIQLYN